MEFFWSHGLISDSTYNMFTRVCNYSRYVSEYYRDSVSLFVQRLWANWAEKPVNLWTNMMSHLMFAFPQCYHNPKLFVLNPKWVFSFGLALLMLLQFPSHYFHKLIYFRSVLLKFGLFIKILALYHGMAGSKWEHRCVCRWQGYKLLKQERCTRGTSCKARWRSQVGCLQQVIPS